MASRKLAIGISLLAAICIVAIAVQTMQLKPKNQTVKIALSGVIPQGELSPENISTIPLFHLHYNLWDTLVTSDRKAAIAKTFAISSDGLSYTFELDPEAKFSNGRSIAPVDVVSSIERIMAREENGHINAKSTIRKIELKGNNQLTIHLIKATPAFLYLVSTPEFGIVPREAIGENQQVVNLSITSGAYTLEEMDFEKQQAILLRNPFFRRGISQSPEKVELRFNAKIDAEVFNKLANDEYFDFIELQTAESRDLLKIASDSGYFYKATLPSVSVFMVANSKLVEARAAKYYAAGFRTHFKFEWANELEQRSNQFFPPKTFGSLLANEVPAINQELNSPPIEEIKIRTLRKTGVLIEEITRAFSALGTNVSFIDWDSTEEHHYWFLSQGMNTEHPEIELHLDILSPYQIFNADDATKNSVTAATHEVDATKRSAIIKGIGEKFISSGKVIPLTTRAYVHIYRPERLNLDGVTKYDGDVPIVQMRIQP